MVADVLEHLRKNKLKVHCAGPENIHNPPPPPHFLWGNFLWVEGVSGKKNLKLTCLKLNCNFQGCGISLKTPLCGGGIDIF